MRGKIRAIRDGKRHQAVGESCGNKQQADQCGHGDEGRDTEEGKRRRMRRLVWNRGRRPRRKIGHRII